MKLSKIILTGVIATAFTSGAFAQAEPVAIQAEAIQVEEAQVAEVMTADPSSEAMAIEEANEAKEIKISELPQAVQQSLKTDLYKGWKATRAWLVKKDKKNLYKVEVANAEDKTQNLLFDENGIAID